MASTLAGRLRPLLRTVPIAKQQERRFAVAAIRFGTQALRGQQERRTAAAAISCRLFSERLFMHARYGGKFEIPDVDKDGNAIPRSPNGYVSKFELIESGALTPETAHAYEWSKWKSSNWYVLFMLNFGLGFWTAYLLINNGEHMFFLDSKERKAIKRELREKDEAARAAATTSA